MSQRPISLSPDLKRLRDEGFNVRVAHGHLYVADVPYLDSNRNIQRGTLVTHLDLAGDRTVPHPDHVMHFCGGIPCDLSGAPLSRILLNTNPSVAAPNVRVDCSFSSKPTNGYADYYEKVSTYAKILSAPAQAIDTTATPQTFRAVPTDAEDGSPFAYEDTASSRSGISALAERLALQKVAIVGLGGTGAYILDLIVKTPVREIFLFDEDKFLNHNAFRSPGAATIEILDRQLPKTEYFRSVYSNMHRNVISRPMAINQSNVDELRLMNFVFVCIDDGPAKRSLVSSLVEFGIPFIDCGMGLNLTDATQITGVVRVTTSTPAMRAHFDKHVSYAAADANDVYENNIQVADLNALNAVLAVIRWKRLFGFYVDLEREHQSAYAVNGNFILNEERS